MDGKVLFVENPFISQKLIRTHNKVTIISNTTIQQECNGRSSIFKILFLHKSNHNSCKNGHNQLFQNSEKEPKACNNPTNIYSRKMAKSEQEEGAMQQP